MPGDHGATDPSWIKLAQRGRDGVHVTLLWTPAAGEAHDRVVKIAVCDNRQGAYYEILVAPYLALDVFLHPEAYKDFSSVRYEDPRLAAANDDLGAFAVRGAGRLPAHAWASRRAKRSGGAERRRKV